MVRPFVRSAARFNRGYARSGRNLHFCQHTPTIAEYPPHIEPRGRDQGPAEIRLPACHAGFALGTAEGKPFCGSDGPRFESQKIQICQRSAGYGYSVRGT